MNGRTIDVLPSLLVHDWSSVTESSRSIFKNDMSSCAQASWQNTIGIVSKVTSGQLERRSGFCRAISMTQYHKPCYINGSRFRTCCLTLTFDINGDPPFMPLSSEVSLEWIKNSPLYSSSRNDGRNEDYKCLGQSINPKSYQHSSSWIQKWPSTWNQLNSGKTDG